MAKQITVKTVGTPPLAGAESFAKMIQQMHVQKKLKLVYDAAQPRKKSHQNGG